MLEVVVGGVEKVEEEEEEEAPPPRLACQGKPSLRAEASSTSPVISEKTSPQMASRSALSSADSSACLIVVGFFC